MGDILKRWFHLGFTDAQWDIYRKTANYQIALAKDNIELLQPVSFFSAVLVMLFLAARTVVFHLDEISVGVFLAAAFVFLMMGLAARNCRDAKNPVEASWRLSFLFCLTWYVLAIAYDTFIQPGTASVLTCITFSCLPIMFDANPRYNVIGSVSAYFAFALFQVTFAPTNLLPLNLIDALTALLIGVYLGQKKTSADAARQMYVDMYHTATEATTLVVQIDLRANTFEALQIPDFVTAVAPASLPATEAIRLVTQHFIAPESRDDYSAIMDFEYLSHAFDDENTHTLNLVFQSYRYVWFQMVVKEETRYQGKTSSIVVVVHDIDFVKQQELAYQRQLKETALEAQRANDSKTNFLRRMSHDVRTPINGIRGVLDMMESCPDDSEKQAELRLKAKDASDYLLALVNSILDLGKLESGKITLESIPFDLRDVLDESNYLAGLQAKDHGISFGVDDGKLNMPHIKLIGSPLHLRQILLNIATNAIKYNVEGGTVTIWANELSFDADGKTVMYEFVCKDTGIGMSEEFQQRAFEPFVQANNDARTVMNGSGLGLSIVKEMAERMGGTISLESELGVGSTFTITIPFKVNEQESADTEIADEELDLTGKTALLVDDNELNREIADFTLGKLGLNTVHATNGKEAVEMYAASAPGTFDMIFMDVMMPVMDGLAATRAIRALPHPEADTVPIFAMTANAFQDDIKQSLDAGMDSHLSKPLDISQIKRVLKLCL
jgi:signal transduction histidine kinase/ActR/RegA family two-component response regulator